MILFLQSKCKDSKSCSSTIYLSSKLHVTPAGTPDRQLLAEKKKKSN